MVHTKYNFQAEAEALVLQLAAAHAEDKAAESRTRYFGWSSVGLLLGTLLLFIFPPYGPMLAVPAGFGLLGCIVGYFYYARQNIDDDKLAAATRLLKILRVDVAKGVPVALTIDFREYAKGGQLQDKKGGYFGPKVYKYRHCWLGLRSKLADGRIIRLSVTDDVTRKEKPKRKYTKIREVSASEVAIGIRLGRPQALAAVGRLNATKPPAPFVSAATASNGEWLTARLITQRSSRLQGRYGPIGALRPAGADEVLQGLLWAYRSIAAPSAA